MAALDQSSDTTRLTLAFAVARYVEAKSRVGDTSQAVWQKVIYRFIAADRPAQG